MKYSINLTIDSNTDTTSNHIGILDTVCIKQTQQEAQGKQNLIMSMPDDTKVLIECEIKNDDETLSLGKFKGETTKGVATAIINAINVANATL